MLGGGGFKEISTLGKFHMAGFILVYENWDRYDFKALHCKKKCCLD